MDNTHKIIEIKIENYKTISAIDLTPASDVVSIAGDNGAGKSSIIESILNTLKGGNIDKNVIKQGTEQSTIEIDFGDFIIKKIIKADKTPALDIRMKETGYQKLKGEAPQAFIDRLASKMIDVEEFRNMDSKKQVGLLLASIGVDTASIEKADKEYSEWFDKRKIEKQMLQKLQGYVSECGNIKEPDESLRERYDGIKGLIKINEDKKATHKINMEVIENCDQGISRLKAKNEQLAIKIKEIENEMLSNEEKISAFEDLKLEKLSSYIGDFKSPQDALEKIDGFIDMHKKELQQAESYVTDKAKYDTYAEKVKEAKKQSDMVDECENKVAAALEKKKALLSQGKMPIDGMEISEGKIFYFGIPYDQIEESMKIKICLAIAIAQNPAIRVLLIRDGSRLGEKSMKLVKQWAKENDFQIFIERVESMPSSDKNQIFMEDGKALTEEEKKEKLSKLYFN